MTPPKIDLGKICPELAELHKRLIHLPTDDDMTTITRAYIEAIAATMLKLMEEKRKRDTIISEAVKLIKYYADTDDSRIQKLFKRIKRLAARKGDGV